MARQETNLLPRRPPLEPNLEFSTRQPKLARHHCKSQGATGSSGCGRQGERPISWVFLDRLGNTLLGRDAILIVHPKDLGEADRSVRRHFREYELDTSCEISSVAVVFGWLQM